MMASSAVHAAGTQQMMKNGGSGMRQMMPTWKSTLNKVPMRGQKGLFSMVLDMIDIFRFTCSLLPELFM